MKRLRMLAAEQYRQQVDCEVDMSTADHHNIKLEAEDTRTLVSYIEIKK